MSDANPIVSASPTKVKEVKEVKASEEAKVTRSTGKAEKKVVEEVEPKEKEYTCVSYNDVKEDVREKISKLFPESSLVGLAAFLRTLMTAKDKEGYYQKGVKPCYIARGGAFEKVVHFRSRLLIDILLENKEKGLAAVTTHAEAVALAHRLLSCNRPPFVFVLHGAFPSQHSSSLGINPL